MLTTKTKTGKSKSKFRKPIIKLKNIKDKDKNLKNYQEDKTDYLQRMVIRMIADFPFSAKLMNSFKIGDKIEVNLEFYTLQKCYSRFRAKQMYF